MITVGDLSRNQRGYNTIYFCKTIIKVDIGGGDYKTGLNQSPGALGGAGVKHTSGLPIHVMALVPEMTKTGTFRVSFSN